MRRFSQTRKTFAHIRIFFELIQSHERANAQTTFAVRLNLIEPANPFQVHHPGGPSDVFLHGRQKILAAGDRSRCVVKIVSRGPGLQRVDSFRDAGRVHPFEGFHALCPPFISAIRTLSGVMGRSRMRAPAALNTAFAIAPIPGMIEASAMPITASRLSSSSISGTISGISSVPGSL